MSIIAFSNVTKTYGPVCVFNGLTISFHKGQKVGIIGQNGSGKTTLFRMILDKEAPDTGTINVRKDLKIGYLPQEPDFQSDKTVLEIIHEGFDDLFDKQRRLECLSAKLGTLGGPALKQTMAEYDRLARELELEGRWSLEARIHSILSGLGLTEDVHQVPVKALSGGQVSRLGLACVLVRDSDLLLLDEPTNHLDLQAICWLETFLRNYTGALLVISHDRFLLDQLVTRVVEIEGKKAVSYTGAYTQYLLLKQQNRLCREREHLKRKEFVRKTLDFIARNKDREGMRKTARGRKTRLRRHLTENPDFLDSPFEKKKISMRFSNSIRRSDKIIVATGIAKSFGDHLLFKDLSFALPKGARIAITGPNGSGKSTLLKILLGEILPDEGAVERGETLTIGYLDQHARTLDPCKTVIEEATAVRPDLAPEALRGRLAAFLFQGEQVFQSVKTLSGGQRNRLMLCKLVLADPDVLILDEPTNHLDIDSREIFEDALLDYEGAVAAVSHDRYFIDLLFNKLLVIGLNQYGRRSPGSIVRVHKMPDERGVYSLWNEQVAAATEQETKAKDIHEHRGSHAASFRKMSQKAPPDIRRFNAMSISDLEEKIMLLEEEIKLLTEQFGHDEICKSPNALRELADKLDHKRAELALIYKAYEWRIKK